jgi:cell division protein FtsB
MTKFIRILIVLFGFVLVFRTGSNVWRLYKTGDRVANAREKLAKVTRENEELKQKAEEVNDPEYMEKLAREKLGYGYEGEVVLVMPEEQVESGKLKVENENIPNWQKWGKLYLGV